MSAKPRPRDGARRGSAAAAPRVVAPRLDEPASTRAGLVVALVAAAVAVIAYRGALAYGFSQDDWSSLARVRGLAPRMASPWRILANQWFWDAGVALFGLNAAPFHAVVLAAHSCGAALLGWLLSRRFAAPAALLGAVVWAVHPSIRTALYWTSANSEPFMTLFLLAATAWFFSRGAARWLAPVCFAIALAWKESGLPFPLALAALAWLGPAPRRSLRELARDPVLWTLAAVAAAWALGIASFVGSLRSSSHAYDVSVASAGRNLLTYAAWTPSWILWLVRDVSDAVRPDFLLPGALVLAAAAVLAMWTPTRTRGVAGAAIAALVLLLPVLPLAHHTYRYYLLAPLAAVAVANAACFAAATAALAPRVRWAAGGALALALAVSAISLVHMLEIAPYMLPGSRADGTIDRALIATHMIEDVRAARLPPHTRLVAWSPLTQEMAQRQGLDVSKESYVEINARAALLDGLALRVAVPELDSVTFVRDFVPADSTATWALYRWDGRTRVLPAHELAKLVELAPGP